MVSSLTCNCLVNRLLNSFTILLYLTVVKTLRNAATYATGTGMDTLHSTGSQ
jgi:hypothetical protein